MDTTRNKKLLLTTFIAIVAILIGLVVLVLKPKYTLAPTTKASPEEAQAGSVVIPIPPELFTYAEIVDGCGPYWEGACVNVRSGPGEEYESVLKLRTGVVLKAGDPITVNGQEWYKVIFDEWIRYPERVAGDWYVSARYIRLFEDVGIIELPTEEIIQSSKHILVDRSDQMLYAYDGDTLFMQEPISTGLDDTPTPRGTFKVYRKSPTRYMQGPLPGISDQYYDLPGVPWNLYFTEQGGVIHGAYWHDKFGQQWSHGCVNLSPDKAHKLYDWADIGMEVLVRD